MENIFLLINKYIFDLRELKWAKLVRNVKYHISCDVGWAFFLPWALAI